MSEQLEVVTQKTLAELALEEYASRNVSFTPMYPAVLVRVLPKEKVSRSGLIHLPDDKVNKPIYEGIVLKTYPPRTIKVNDKWVLVDSGLKEGDHILFPHWSGEKPPKELFDDGNESSYEEYRMIPARGGLSLAGNKESGEPFLVLSYEKESVKDKLLKLVEFMMENDASAESSQDVNLDLFEKKLREYFDITVKVTIPKTTSGE